MENCPNCNKKINPNSIFTSNVLLSPGQIKFINEFIKPEKAAYCGMCGNHQLNLAEQLCREEIENLKKNNKQLIDSTPCLSIDNPLGWQYESVSIITAQSTMGTGFISELSSDWNDIFGLESKTMNRKVSTGEENCMSIIRAKALFLNCNAVIGIDIDYAEVGSLRGMILVCVTGTAIKVKNLEVLPEDSRNIEVILTQNNERLAILKSYL